VAVALGLALISSGCGSASRPITENPIDGVALEDVGEAYRVFTIMLCPTGVRAMKQGEVVVLWGATLPDTGEEPGKADTPEVLAYQKQVPEQGGYVLLLNRTIRKMTADEFKAAPKAGKN
jgi:hypothetical protein